MYGYWINSYCCDSDSDYDWGSGMSSDGSDSEHGGWDAPDSGSYEGD